MHQACSSEGINGMAARRNGASGQLPQRVVSWARVRAAARAEAVPAGRRWMGVALAGRDSRSGRLRWWGRRRWVEAGVRIAFGVASSRPPTKSDFGSTSPPTKSDFAVTIYSTEKPQPSSGKPHQSEGCALPWREYVDVR